MSKDHWRLVGLAAFLAALLFMGLQFANFQHDGILRRLSGRHRRTWNEAAIQNANQGLNRVRHAFEVQRKMASRHVEKSHPRLAANWEKIQGSAQPLHSLAALIP